MVNQVVPEPEPETSPKSILSIPQQPPDESSSFRTTIPNASNNNNQELEEIHRTTTQITKARKSYGEQLGKMIWHFEPSVEQRENKTNELRNRSKNLQRFKWLSINETYLKVNCFIESEIELKEFNERQNSKWFSYMLVAIIERGKLHIGSKNVKSKLSDLTKDEGRTIGESLKYILISSSQPETAVDEWILMYPSLKELDTQEDWIRPFFNELAKLIMLSSMFGLKMRVYSGVIISWADMASDLIMIFKYINEKQYNAAKLQSIFILLNTLAQLSIVWIQKGTHGKVTTTKETLYVILQLKGAVDAHRVISGVDQQEGALSTPLVEMLHSKLSEIVLESIPSGLVQTYYLLTSENVSSIAIVSIVISSFTTGFGIASVAFDLDTSVEKRKINPRFFGYVPDTGRGLIFVLMIVMSASLSMMKNIGLSLLYVANRELANLVVVAEMAIFIVYKAFRGDLRCYLKLSGVTSWIMTILGRILTKIAVDFTGLVHLRHPYEIGGLYSSISIALSQLICCLGAYLYLTTTPSNSDTAISSTLVWSCIVTLLIVFNSACVCFLLKIKREYVKTFFTTMTGPEFACLTFKLAITEEEKFSIFDQHPIYFVAIKDELKTWLNENWKRWNEEKPVWFTKSAIADIPNDIVPAEELRRHGGKRKESLIDLGDVLRGSVINMARKGSVIKDNSVSPIE